MTTVVEHARDSRTPLRSDLSPADALALSCLVYVDFHALPGPRSPRGCLLREVAQASSIPSLYRYSLASHADRPLLEAAGVSARFGGLRVRDAVTRLTSSPLAQFGAVTFVDEAGATYVVFRGTDASAVGWAALIFRRIHSGGPRTTWRTQRRRPIGQSPWSVIRRGRISRCTRRLRPLPRRSSASTRLIPWVFPRRLLTVDFSRASTGSCTST